VEDALPKLKLVVLAGVTALAGAQGLASVTPSTVAAGGNWSGYAGGSDETDYSGLGQVNVGNVGRLGLAWSLDLPDEASLEATPLAVNGVLYFTGSHATVYAVNGATGKLLWKYDPETWRVAPKRLGFAVFSVNRGAAYDNGKIFAAALDGRLFALDAKSGKLLWTVQTLSERGYQTVTGAPRTFNGKVIIGQAGADIGARGYVTAYDQSTGKQVWRFYVTPGTPEENKGDPAMEAAEKTWHGQWWKTGTGGGPWNAITFDARLNRIYIGTANASPYDSDARSPGGGDNLYTASIVALDADTGKYAWHYQVNPNDSWDYDCTQQITLATLTINGTARNVLMQAPKNGFFYVIDRDSGKLISAEKIGKVNWADRIDISTGRPVERPNMHHETGDLTIYPGSSGGHNWQAMSFDPESGTVFIPYLQIGTHFTRGKPLPGGIEVGGVHMDWANLQDSMDGKGALIAWDPVHQKERWRVVLPSIWNGGTLATAGGLVFQGTGDGYLSAYDAGKGARLWRSYAGLGIIAAPMTFSIGKRQYISVLVGYGASAAAMSQVANMGWKYGRQPRRLLTFALDATRKLPPTQPPSFEVNALDNPSFKLDAEEVDKGAELYARCMGCHGRAAVSTGGPAPDLRESAIAFDREAFGTLLREGSPIQRGMPSFSYLKSDQVDAIYAYIRAQVRKVTEHVAAQK
jgi:quinohemoprotein ethanol dehydrogenase